MTVSFPPGLLLVLGAFLLPLVRGRGKDVLVLGLPLLTLVAIWMVPDGVALRIGFLDYVLEPVEATAVGRVFATAFALTAGVGGLFAVRTARLTEIVAAFVYAGASIGVTFAGDLFTLFVCWELMAVGSTVVIWSSDQPGAWAASMRYLMIDLLGGVILMAGIAGYVAQTGSVDLVAMQPDSVATWLIFIGFLINVGAPPISAWIADVYPEGSPSGMVFLATFTTKTAVFALLVGFPGTQILIPIGLYMAVYGIVYALLENDMRRILAYASVNQMGFMLAGVGIGTELSLNGTTAHAFAHIVYKALLLMSAGSVLLVTGKRKCSELGGLFRTMPFTMVAGVVGALAISSFPFASGFVSKSLISQAAADEHLTVAWFVLTAASAGVFLHAGLKFVWFVFFQEDSGLRPPEPPVGMRVAMGIFAILCIALGIFPGTLYSALPYAIDYEPYTAAHLVGQFQLLLFTGLAFFLMLPMLKKMLGIALDWDWFYRRLGPRVVGRTTELTAEVRLRAEETGQERIRAIIRRLFRVHGPHGMLARTWPTGSMVLWVAVLLGAILLLSFV